MNRGEPTTAHALAALCSAYRQNLSASFPGALTFAAVFLDLCVRVIFFPIVLLYSAVPFVLKEKWERWKEVTLLAAFFFSSCTGGDEKTEGSSGSNIGAAQKKESVLFV